MAVQACPVWLVCPGCLAWPGCLGAPRDHRHFGPWLPGWLPGLAWPPGAARGHGLVAARERRSKGVVDEVEDVPLHNHVVIEEEQVSAARAQNLGNIEADVVEGCPSGGTVTVP